MTDTVLQVYLKKISKHPEQQVAKAREIIESRFYIRLSLSDRMFLRQEVFNAIEDLKYINESYMAFDVDREGAYRFMLKHYKGISVTSLDSFIFTNNGLKDRYTLDKIHNIHQSIDNNLPQSS